MSFNNASDDAPELTTFDVITTLPFEFCGLPKFKVVKFFGLLVAVPKGFKWIAADYTGAVYAFRKKPCFDGDAWIIKDGHIRDFDESECVPVANLTYHLDDITEEQAEKSRVRIKDLPRYYP